jgi:LysR family glycine cleavage system transcriptional activator
MNLIHTRQMNALPPFDALMAFDATLRHRSMTRAAAELGITQSAVSHRLRKLEGFMGTPVLCRTSAGIVATPAGIALADGLADLIGGLAGLRSRCRAAVTPNKLRVGVGSALADHWLVRRLPNFAARDPDTAIELVIVNDANRDSLQDLDVQVVWQPVDEARSSSTQRLLFQEHVFPVCHPRFLRDGQLLRSPAGLLDVPLLHKGLQPMNHATEWDWSVWFERLKLAHEPPRGIRFAVIGTAIAAAMQGAGAVLARSLLVRDALAENRLCRLLPESWDMPSSKAHIVRWPAALTGDRRVQAFVNWLTDEAERARPS